jgi:nitrilase
MTQIVSALQIGSSKEGTAATLSEVLSFEREIRAARSSLVVMPEALLGGYPIGQAFGTRVGYRVPAGREEFAAYHAEAITVPGPETDALAKLSQRTQASLVVGAIEKDGATLYCTALYFDPEKGLVGKRRKLRPTGAERLIWGQGDGSDIKVMETPMGVVGAVICWEHYMPLLRTAFYAKKIDIWCAVTVEDRDIWQSSMRHIAFEGRCFVVSACQVQPTPAELGRQADGWPPDQPLIKGGSVIVSPFGDVIAGPSYTPGLLSAQIDLRDLVRSRYDFDVIGHYSRPDIFTLLVDDRATPGFSFETSRSVVEERKPETD